MSYTYFTLNMLMVSVYIKIKPQLISFLTRELREKMPPLGVGGKSQGLEIPLTLKDEILFKSQSNCLLEIMPKSVVGVLWQYGSISYVLAS